MSSEIGRLGLALVGVVGGFILAGPTGAAIGLALGTAAGSILFPPEGKTIEGQRLNDLKVSFSSYGKPIPRIYGTMETGGNVVWSPGLVEHRVEEEVGGKGGPSVTRVTFLYTASFRINYSVGVAQAILRNWADGKLLVELVDFDPVDTLGGIVLAIALGFEDHPGNQAIRNFLGTATQLPGPAEQADKGVANTSAYRGTVGQEFEDLPLEDYGNRIPQITAEIAMVATETFPKVTLDGVDFNGTQWEWQERGETFLISGVTRIDNVTQSVLNTFGTLTNGFPAVNADGNFFSATSTFGLTTGVVSIKDGVTLQTTSVGSQLRDPRDGSILGGSLGWVRLRSFGGVIDIQGRLVGQLLFMQRQIRSLVVIIDPRLIGNGVGGVINIFDTAEVITSTTVAVDGERHLWASYNLAGDTHLLRFRPGTGGILETHTLVGDQTDFISYEPSTNSLILGDVGESHLIRWSLDTNTIEARLDNFSFDGSKNSSEFWNGPNAAGVMYIQVGGALGTFKEVDVIQMVAGRSWNPGTDFGTSTNLTHRGMYDPLHHAMIKRKDTGGRIYWLFLDRFSGDEITVRSIVEDVSSLVDYTAGTDIDATELMDTLPGYIIRTRMTARKALEPLATAFNFRSVESDWMIKFPKRGGASVGNIPQIDLGATAGEVPTTQALTKKRVAEDQLFETAIIEYIDPTFDNNPNTQQAKRSAEAIDVGGSLKFDFPGALRNDQAAQIIERMLFQAWSGRTNVSTTLPLKHILKDPGDVVTITKDGKTITLEITNIKLGANSVIQLEGVIDDAIVHLSTAVGASAQGVETQVIILSGQSEFFIMDTPLFRDLDDGPGIYVAAGTSEAASWPGASIQRGVSVDALFPLTAVVPSRAATYGFAKTALATASANIFDRTNTVNVQLFSGTLSSSTETLVLGGANAIRIGTELIQFVTATLESDGTYTLSTLLRGRRGTEWATGTHVVGEDAVFLSNLTVLRIGLDLSDHLTTYFYKSITLGSSQLSTKTVEEVLTLRSLMPYAPSHVAGTIAAGEWTITFVRRTRTGGSWKDLVDAPIGEASESYEVDIMSGSTVKRTLASSTESITYTSAQQGTDFGDDQTTIEVNVYQLNADVGRGFVTNKTLIGG